MKLVVTLEILCVGLGHFYWVLVTLKHLCFINITESTSGEVSLSLDKYAGLSNCGSCVVIVSVVFVNQFTHLFAHRMKLFHTLTSRLSELASVPRIPDF